MKVISMTNLEQGKNLQLV